MADPIVHSRRGVDGLLALISGFLLALLIWTGADLLSGDNADEIEREASPTERAEPVESESSRTDPPPSGLGSPAISARGDLRSVFSGDDYPTEAADGWRRRYGSGATHCRSGRPRRGLSDRHQQRRGIARPEDLRCSAPTGALHARARSRRQSDHRYGDHSASALAVDGVTRVTSLARQA